MRKLITPQGGQPVNLTDFKDIQDELYKAVEGQYEGLAFVSKGVVISGTSSNATISAGLVYLDNEFLEFAGASAVDFDANPTQYLEKVTTTGRPKNFTVGGIKDTREITSASLVTTLPTGQNITLTFAGHNQSYLQIIGKVIEPIGSIKMVSSVSDFNTTTGLGAGVWADWRLCNGVAGTPDLRGRFVVGFNPNDVDYNTIGKLGGFKEVTLGISQIPPHNHKLVSSTPSNTNPLTDSNQISFSSSGGGGTDLSAYVLTGTSDSAILGNSSQAGGGLPHENRPPFYTLAYITKYK